MPAGARRARMLVLGAVAAAALAAPAESPGAGPTCFGRPATVVGSNGPDTLAGTRGPDVIVGRGGRDVIRGRGGGDRICAGDGDDLVLAGAGRDRVSGGPGTDTCYEGAGGGRLVSCELPLRAGLVYETSVPVVDAEYATELAADAFDLVGETSEDAHLVTVQDGLRALHVHKASAALQYEDGDKLLNGTYPGTALGRAEAIDLALAFLEAGGLLPEEAEVGGAKLVHVVRADGTTVPNHWRVTFRFLLRASVAGDPLVEVPVDGAVLEVAVGDDEVIGVYRSWRPVAPNRTVALFSRERALALAGDVPVGAVAAPRLSYPLAPESAEQPFLAPLYTARFRGIDGGVTVPASRFSPRVSIPSPVREPGGEMTFRAEVGGGSPPYELEWSSSLRPSETLGTGSPLTLSLPDGVQRVRVEVVDGRGVRAEAERVVRVTAGGTSPRAEALLPAPGWLQPSGKEVHAGWTVWWQVTPDDGLAVFDVLFDGTHHLAADVRMPFYELETERMPLQACELTAAPAAAGNCRSFFAGATVTKSESALEIQASWQVIDLPAGVGGALTVTQRYVFRAETTGCAPLDPARCARFLPTVSYAYGAPGPPEPSNEFRRLEATQKLDFNVPARFAGGRSKDIAAFFRNGSALLGRALNPARIAPLRREFGAQSVVDWPGHPNTGRGSQDDYHQRPPAGLHAGDPGIAKPGCTFRPAADPWQCAHVHWWWPPFRGLPGVFLASQNAKFGGGKALVPPPQRVRAWALLFRFDEQAGDPPGCPPTCDVQALQNGEAFDTVGGTDVALWLETSSTKAAATFSANDWFFR